MSLEFESMYWNNFPYALKSSAQPVSRGLILTCIKAY